MTIVILGQRADPSLHQNLHLPGDRINDYLHLKDEIILQDHQSVEIEERAMATEKQARMIRIKQRQVGGKISSMKQLAPMTHRTVQEWVKMLDSGINPYDGTGRDSTPAPECHIVRFE